MADEDERILPFGLRAHPVDEILGRQVGQQGIGSGVVVLSTWSDFEPIRNARP